MNREIKFRGIATKGNWVYGSLITDLDYWICDHSLPSDPELPLIIVRKESVGQFTGHHDKNGKEIYEGDIVDSWAGLKDNTEPYIRTVVWRDTGLRFDPLTGYNLCERNQHLFEIIGNIYEHPELLTSQTK